MNVKKHGSGLSHRDVVRFSNRLARFSNQRSSSSLEFDQGFTRGWNACCKYFCHELRLLLREIESINQ